MARKQLSAAFPHPPAWHVHASRAQLASALAQEIAAVLAAAIAARGAALLAVSGGTTPAGFFRALSGLPLDWRRVTVTLVDERLVPESEPRSNAALVRENLLRGDAAAATFVGLYRGSGEPEAARAKAAAALAALPFPLDAAVLGMGLDGHTASFFPDAPNLSDLLDPARPERVLAVQAPSGGEPRLTLSLSAILEAGTVALHIEGAEKRAVLEAVLEGETRPVGAVFRHARAPVGIHWAP